MIKMNVGNAICGKRVLTYWLLAIGYWLLSGPAWAQNTSLHLPEGQRVSFNWEVKDGQDNRWGINANGNVQSGTNSPYGHAMRLTVTDGQDFSSGGNSRMGESGREIEVGPWQHGSVQVWRRVYVDDKQGYCRWIDIFENTSGEPFRMALCYRNGMSSSINEVLSARGAKTIEAKDYAFATMFRESSNRPVIVHVIASPSAKTRPRVQWKAGSNEVQYYYDLTVEPGKPVALVFFHSQQPNVTKAKAFMKSFDVSAELAKVPAPLRAILANAPASAATGGSVERVDIPRDAKDDLAVLRNGDQLRGTITTETFVVKTIFGEMKIPAAQVVGLSLPQDEDAYAQLILTDGQILAGDLTSPVVMKLSSGQDVKLAARDFRSAAYKVSESKPAEVKVAGSHIVLRNGQRLYVADMPTLEFSTLHGKFPLGERQVSRIIMDTPEGGLHRAMFRNGSVLSGLLTAEKLSARLALGAAMNVSVNMVARIEFGGEDIDAKPSVQITLRNEDVIHGSLTDAELSLLTGTGSRQSVKLADVVSMEFDPESMGKVALTLRSGTTMSGKLQSKGLTFIMDGGLELGLFLGHVVTVTINTEEEPEEPAAPAEPPAVGEVDKPADDAKRAETAARENVLAAEEAQRKAEDAKAASRPVLRPQTLPAAR